MGTKSDKCKSWRMKLKKILIHKLLQIKQIAIKKMRAISDIKIVEGGWSWKKNQFHKLFQINQITIIKKWGPNLINKKISIKKKTRKTITIKRINI